MREKIVDRWSIMLNLVPHYLRRSLEFYADGSLTATPSAWSDYIHLQVYDTFEASSRI